MSALGLLYLRQFLFLFGWREKALFGGWQKVSFVESPGRPSEMQVVDFPHLRPEQLKEPILPDYLTGLRVEPGS